MMKVYIILSAAVCIFFAKTYSISLGSDPFSSGKPCSANTDCNTGLGVSCCGVNTTYGRCCPDSLCITNCNASDSTFYYCGSVCPDYPKTTQSTPSYLSTTKSTTTTATTTTASNAITTTSAATTTTASNATTTTSAVTTTTASNATTTISITTT